MLPFLGILPSTNFSMLPSSAKALGPASIGGGANGGGIVCPPGTDALDKATDVAEKLLAELEWMWKSRTDPPSSSKLPFRQLGQEVAATVESPTNFGASGFGDFVESPALRAS